MGILNGEHRYGVPFSHLFTELQISPIEVHISPIQLQISTIDLQISTTSKIPVRWPGQWFTEVLLVSSPQLE